MIIIKDVSIFDGISIKNNRNVFIKKNKILDIKKSIPHICKEDDKIKIIEGNENLLIPGFIDIQVNGGGGIFFNHKPSVHTLKKIFQAHLKFGTTSIFPTFISDSLSQLKKCILAVEKSCKEEQAGIIGFHIEGPFINKEKKGIHPENNITCPSNEWLNVLLGIKAPNILITLAPEMVQADFIKTLVKAGLHVFAGHTNATASDMQKAFEHGVSGITHLYNACSQISARDVGVVGAGLLKKQVLCSLILDEKHISHDALKIAFKVQDPRNFVLISDAMQSVGANLTEFMLFNENIYLNQEKELKNSAGTLAGAHLTMLWAFQNLIKKKLISLEESIRMTSTNQARYFNLKYKGAVLPGYDANLLLLDKNNFDLLHVIFFGKI